MGDADHNGTYVEFYASFSNILGGIAIVVGRHGKRRGKKRENLLENFCQKTEFSGTPTPPGTRSPNSMTKMISIFWGCMSNTRWIHNGLKSIQDPWY
jgi:hypothetical protein